MNAKLVTEPVCHEFRGLNATASWKIIDIIIDVTFPCWLNDAAS